MTNGTADPLPDDILDGANMGGDIFMAYVHIIVWSVFLCICEISLLKKCRRFCHLRKLKPSTRNMDEIPDDVKEEEDLVETSSPMDAALRVFRLRKVYKHNRKCCGSCLPNRRQLAIDGVSFGTD